MNETPRAHATSGAAQQAERAPQGGAEAGEGGFLTEPVSERRLLTVLFCDLVDSTALGRRLDPEDLAELLSGYRDRVADEVERFGGVVINIVGDGVVACFGYPRGHEGDAERAILAGLAITGAIPAADPAAGLAVRVGIATGPVLVGAVAGERVSEAAGLVGEAPNLASRLQSLAPAGGVVVADRTRALAGEHFVYDDLGTHVLKGFEAPVRCWRVVAAHSAGRSFHDAGRSGLVGRGDELAALEAAWRDACAGEGRTVAVAGEPGIGKSRLIADAWSRFAAPAGERLVLQCAELYANTALHPVSAWLEQAAGLGTEESAETRLSRLKTFAEGELSCGADAVALLARLLSIPGEASDRVRELPPREFRERLLTCLVEGLAARAARRPLFLAVEDLHWADATTLDLIERMIEAFARQPVLLVLSFRAAHLTALASRHDIRLLALRGLADSDAADLARRLLAGREVEPALVERVVARCDGNPLFIEAAVQMVDAGDAAHPDLPPTLHAVLQARLDRLGPGRRVAQFASVLGRRFLRDQLVALWPFHEEGLAAGLRALEAEGLLGRENGSQDAEYGFAHALIREAAYDSLLRRDRRRFHGHVAARLEADFPGLTEREPHLLALHHAAAGNGAAAVPYRARAAAIALARSAYVEALAHLEGGLSLLDRLDGDAVEAASRSRLELELRLPYGAALVATRGYATPEVEANYRRIHDLARTCGDDGVIVQALLGLSRAAIVRAEIDRALELTEEMLVVSRRLDRPELRLTAELLHGISLFTAGRLREADRHLSAALAAWDRDRDRGLAHRLGQDPGITALVWSAQTAWLRGDHPRAIELRRDALDAARALGHPFTLAYVLLRLAALDRLRGESGAGLALAREADELARTHAFPAFAVSARFWLADFAAGDGDPAALAAMVGEIDAHADTDQRNMVAWLWLCVVERALSLGDSERARFALARCAEEIAGTGVRWCEAEMHRMRARLASGEGERAAARDALEAALAVARRQGARALGLRSALELSALLLDDGGPAAARQALAGFDAGAATDGDTPDTRALRALLARLARTATNTNTDTETDRGRTP